MFLRFSKSTLFIFALTTSHVADPLSAEQISVTTTFTCSTDAECKRKCEALGSDHVWKPNPGGSTLGTCTKRLSATLPRQEAFETLGAISDNSAVIEREINAALANSARLRELGLTGLEVGTFAILLKGRKDDERACASCRGSGITVERCCPADDLTCDPCWEGKPITADEIELMAPTNP